MAGYLVQCVCVILMVLVAFAQGGYGLVTLNPGRRLAGTLNNIGSEFPLTLGRDFSGVVVDKGRSAACDSYKIGEEVWGAVSPFRQGTHAQYQIVSAKEISRKPHVLSHVEAASIPYVAGTAWSALCSAGGLTKQNAHSKRILVLGGSGGVGTFAIQLCRAWGAEVTTTCSTDSIDQVLALGADIALDYKTCHVRAELDKIKGYDIILDLIGANTQSYMSLLQSGANAKFVTIVTPMMKNNDSYGLPFGMVKNARDLGCNVLSGLKDGHHYRWGMFAPSREAMQTVADLVNEGKIVPVVERVFAFEDLSAAYEKVASKHNRGKTVIDMKQGH